MVSFREFAKVEGDVAYLSLILDDGEVLNWLGNLASEEEILDNVKRAIKVGAVALSSAFVGAGSQTIKEVLEKWALEVEKALGESSKKIVEEISKEFGSQVVEPVEKKINEIKEATTENIKEHMKNLERRIDPSHPDSWLRVVQDAVDRLRNEFDPSKEGSYLWKVRNTLSEFYDPEGKAAVCISSAINQGLESLIEKIESIEKEVIEVKTRLGGLKTEKGFAFETESLRLLLNRIFAITGDTCEHVGSDNRSGDWIINVHYGVGNSRQVIGKIVIEAKDTSLNKNQIDSSLKSAMEYRSADAGILIFARHDQNPYGLSFAPIDEDWTKFVCVWDEEGLNLNFAYQIARMRIIEEHLRCTTDVDWEDLRRKVREIIGEVQRIDDVANKARLASERAEEARSLSEKVKSSLMEKLQDLERKISVMSS